MAQRPMLGQRSLKIAIIGVLVLTLAYGEQRAERYGDRLQIALPLLAFGCSIANGSGAEYFVRYIGMFATTHGSKRGLGPIPLNTRPNGKTHGFPSGHSSTAAFGASGLVYNCLTNAPIVKGVVVIAAGFVGASRIESENHNIWQVLAGILVGWFWERVGRGQGPVRRIASKTLWPFRRAFQILLKPLESLAHRLMNRRTDQ